MLLKQLVMLRTISSPDWKLVICGQTPQGWRGGAERRDGDVPGPVGQTSPAGAEGQCSYTRCGQAEVRLSLDQQTTVLLSPLPIFVWPVH